MKILKQLRTNVNYMAYMSACMIEICIIHTTTFDYQRRFFSQLNLKLHIV